MGTAAIVGAVISGVGSVMSYKSQSAAASAQKDAARDAQRLAEMNAVASERETAQEAENLARQQGKEQAINRARAAATGMAGGGSLDMVMDEQKNIHGKEMSWLQQSGKSRADILRRQGDTAYKTGMAQASSLRSQAKGSLIGGAGSFFGTANKEGWFE